VLVAGVLQARKDSRLRPNIGSCTYQCQLGIPKPRERSGKYWKPKKAHNLGCHAVSTVRRFHNFALGNDVAFVTLVDLGLQIVCTELKMTVLRTSF